MFSKGLNKLVHNAMAMITQPINEAMLNNPRSTPSLEKMRDKVLCV